MSSDTSSTNSNAIVTVLDFSEGKCILAFLNDFQKDNVVLYAQHYALQKDLPLAVLFCVEESSLDESSYQQILCKEKELHIKDIPLMVLIGDTSVRLKGCIKHLKPARFYFCFDSNNSLITDLAAGSNADVIGEENKLKDIIKHPNRWSGPVISVRKLKHRIINNVD